MAITPRLGAFTYSRQRATAEVGAYSGYVAGKGCIFCGGTPLTREHLWPDWLRRQLKIQMPFSVRIEQEEDGVETRDINFETPPFNQQVKAVCAECNNGWMAAIEAAAKPILWPLIHAEGRRLDSDEQRALARWALLRACVFDELHPQERVVAAAHCQHLQEHRNPPSDGLWVSLATDDAEDPRHYAYQGLRLGQDGAPAPSGPNVYFVTITVGCLVLQVRGSLLPDWSFGRVPYLDQLGAVEIWPTTPYDRLRAAQGDDACNAGRLYEAALQRGRSPYRRSAAGPVTTAGCEPQGAARCPTTKARGSPLPLLRRLGRSQLGCQPAQTIGGAVIRRGGCALKVTRNDLRRRALREGLDLLSAGKQVMPCNEMGGAACRSSTFAVRPDADCLVFEQARERVLPALEETGA